MKTTLYLVSTLIEQYEEPTIKKNRIYTNVSDAQIALDTEVEEGMKKFGDCNGELFFDMPQLRKSINPKTIYFIVVLYRLRRLTSWGGLFLS